MTTRTVTTKEELKKAYDDKVDTIIVTGKLAEDLKKCEGFKKLGPAAIAALSAAGIGLVLTPATGGISGVVSMAAASSVAAISGIEIAVIVVAIAIGLSLVISVFRDYKTEFSIDVNKDGEAKATLKRKSIK